MGKHVVLGTGPTGWYTMEELVASGHEVVMVNRSGLGSMPAGVRLQQADLYEPGEAAKVMQGAEAVYQCAQPPYQSWAERFPQLQERIVEGACRTGAKLIVADNLYMYGEVAGPIHEGLPYRADTRKGRLRAELSGRLHEAQRAGRLRAALVRGSDYYGPRATGSVFGGMFFRPLVQGKPARMFGSLDQPHTFTFIRDFGRAMAAAGRHDEALGEVWHVPSAAPVTIRRFAELAYAAAGFPNRVRFMNRFTLRIGGIFVPEARESLEMLYQWEKPFVVDSRKCTERLGLQATPLEQGVRETVEWYRGGEVAGG
ncbi:Nucleoside-diphosphate-sugar epimerase [Paenibacillus sp. UNCCL117]|uniref:NAD-dependent epimerase/dehydratase family protein n=1 Tax=unclassified Paenibacillus TaxID=185978 RepID=UPI00088FE660|nr:MULTISPECIES: NAD-dependent epimerase/dehydratase family protein [unclassified Paenibacillus]SDD62980.1 Nucleoside-diphosphate-sugar epimerase [Paenibacillus sp. cl123]SFW67719.1 Nucleoside-diphosphate-sugar epimerase [Paenibacillus sp. UNCCL117]